MRPDDENDIEDIQIQILGSKDITDRSSNLQSTPKKEEQSKQCSPKPQMVVFRKQSSQNQAPQKAIFIPKLALTHLDQPLQSKRNLKFQ